MPAVSPQILVDAILTAISESGGQAALMSEVRTHPRVLRVSDRGSAFDLWVYAWTITHGGATRSADEFRIQMTSVESPLPLNPDGLTVLIGWHPERNVFCGFDLLRHRTFTTGSPSVQVSLQVLIGALQTGVAFGNKSNEEITVGFRPDQFLNYTRNADRFHAEGAHVQRLLQRATAAEEIPAAEIEQQPPERRKVVETVERLVRDARFRDSVLDAYGHRCAVSGVQLDLLDAAHILPVGAPGSHDLVTNGLALGPTYHRAFDRGLIYLSEDFVMRLNGQKLRALTRAGHDGGLLQFSGVLDRSIALPQQTRHRPSVEMIQLANRFRRI
jgi:putative restriction endonuclease